MLDQKFLRFLTLTVVVIGIQAVAAIAQHPCDAFVNVCTVPSSFNSYTIQDNLVQTTGQVGEPVAHTAYTPAQNPLTTLWYHWTPLVSGVIVVDTRGTNPNAIAPFYLTPYVIDTTVAVYSGTTLGTLVRQAESDNWQVSILPSNCTVARPVGESLYSSCLRFLANAGTTYHFQVDKLSETDPANNSFLLNVALIPSSAASSSISGRVADESGKAIARVRLSLTKSNGEISTAITNAFGYYRFDDLEVGQNYILSASSKGYLFQNNPRVISLSDDVLAEDFVGN